MILLCHLRATKKLEEEKEFAEKQAVFGYTIHVLCDFGFVGKDSGLLGTCQETEATKKHIFLIISIKLYLNRNFNKQLESLVSKRAISMKFIPKPAGFFVQVHYIRRLVTHIQLLDLQQETIW